MLREIRLFWIGVSRSGDKIESLSNVDGDGNENGKK